MDTEILGKNNTDSVTPSTVAPSTGADRARDLAAAGLVEVAHLARQHYVIEVAPGRMVIVLVPPPKPADALATRGKPSQVGGRRKRRRSRDWTQSVRRHRSELVRTLRRHKVGAGLLAAAMLFGAALRDPEAVIAASTFLAQFVRVIAMF